jgi:hypothetical protein
MAALQLHRAGVAVAVHGDERDPVLRHAVHHLVADGGSGGERRRLRRCRADRERRLQLPGGRVADELDAQVDELLQRGNSRDGREVGAIEDALAEADRRARVFEHLRERQRRPLGRAVVAVPELRPLGAEWLVLLRGELVFVVRGGEHQRAAAAGVEMGD